MSGRAPLPALLEQNPRLDQWVGFPAPGRVRVSTGRVEIGQGVLTAMLQIAADELDVAPERIDLLTGDTELTPNEGYTAGSQSIQFGGVALRLACAEIRDLFLGAAAAKSGRKRADLAVRDGAILARGRPTGLDYWSLAPGIDLTRSATAGAPPQAGRRIWAWWAAMRGASISPRKCSARPRSVHDMTAPGMVHAQVIPPAAGAATLASVDEAAIRRAAKGAIEFVRDGNFIAVVGGLDETRGRGRRRRRAERMSRGTGSSRSIRRSQKRGAGCCSGELDDRPVASMRARRRPVSRLPAAQRYEASPSRRMQLVAQLPRSARPANWPAYYRAGGKPEALDAALAAGLFTMLRAALAAKLPKPRSRVDRRQACAGARAAMAITAPTTPRPMRR